MGTKDPQPLKKGESSLQAILEVAASGHKLMNAQKAHGEQACLLLNRLH